MSRHFNGLTPAEAERLALLAEEAGEVIQAVGKILRHGYESGHPDGGDSNRDALARELGHVHFAMDILVAAADLSAALIYESTAAKRDAVQQYLHHAKVRKRKS